MIQEKLTRRQTSDEDARRDDRDGIDLQVFANDDECWVHGCARILRAVCRHPACNLCFETASKMLADRTQDACAPYLTLKNTTCTMCAIIRTSMIEVVITCGATQIFISRCKWISASTRRSVAMRSMARSASARFSFSAKFATSFLKWSRALASAAVNASRRAYCLTR